MLVVVTGDPARPICRFGQWTRSEADTITSCILRSDSIIIVTLKHGWSANELSHPEKLITCASSEPAATRSRENSQSLFEFSRYPEYLSFRIRPSPGLRSSGRMEACEEGVAGVRAPPAGRHSAQLTNYLVVQRHNSYLLSADSTLFL